MVNISFFEQTTYLNFINHISNDKKKHSSLITEFSFLLTLSSVNKTSTTKTVLVKPYIYI